MKIEESLRYIYINYDRFLVI